MRAPLLNPVTLAVLVMAAVSGLAACTDRTVTEAPSTLQPGASPIPDPALTNVTTLKPEADGPPADFAGIWAATPADCLQTGAAWRVDGAKIVAPASAPGGALTCDVTGLDEQHPTGRSAVYALTSSCVHGSAGPTEDVIVLRFGASDTVMQMQINDAQPQRLVRCPG